MNWYGDTVLVMDSEEKLFVGRRVWTKNLRVDGNKSKEIKWTREFGGRRINVTLNKELECFRYLGCNITVDGKIETVEV